MINNQPFTAPNESMEYNIVDFCMNRLGLDFGTFWYHWSSTNSERNYVMHIKCNSKLKIEDIKLGLNSIKEIDVEKFHKVQECPLPDYESENFLYYIHFKNKKEIV